VDDIGTYDTLYSFLYPNFPFDVSHIKFSPPGFFGRWYSGILTIWSRWFRIRIWAYVKGSNNIHDCISWHFSLFSPWVLRSFTWYTGTTLDFSIRFFKEFPPFFLNGFCEKLSYYLFFPTRVFKDTIYDILIFDQIIFRLCL
jgi:hypothetical protein